MHVCVREASLKLETENTKINLGIQLNVRRLVKDQKRSLKLFRKQNVFSSCPICLCVKTVQDVCVSEQPATCVKCSGTV